MKAGILVLGLAVLDLSWEVVFYSFSMAAPGGLGVWLILVAFLVTLSCGLQLRLGAILVLGCMFDFLL